MQDEGGPCDRRVDTRARSETAGIDTAAENDDWDRPVYQAKATPSRTEQEDHYAHSLHTEPLEFGLLIWAR